VQPISWTREAHKDACEFVPDESDPAAYNLGDDAAIACSVLISSDLMNPLLNVMDTDAERVKIRYHHQELMENHLRHMRDQGSARMARHFSCEEDELTTSPALPVPLQFLHEMVAQVDGTPLGHDLARNTIKALITTIYELNWRMDMLEGNIRNEIESGGVKATEEWKKKYPWSKGCDDTVWLLRQDSKTIHLSPGNGVSDLYSLAIDYDFPNLSLQFIY
jgi:hypothetical protein